MEYLVSVDGTSYTSAGRVDSFEDFTLGEPDGRAALEPQHTGRYVRVRIVPGTQNFVFASELSVGTLPESDYDDGGTYRNAALGRPYAASRAPTRIPRRGYADVSDGS